MHSPHGRVPEDGQIPLERATSRKINLDVTQKRTRFVTWAFHWSSQGTTRCTTELARWGRNAVPVKYSARGSHTVSQIENRGAVIVLAVSGWALVRGWFDLMVAEKSIKRAFRCFRRGSVGACRRRSQPLLAKAPIPR